MRVFVYGTLKRGERNGFRMAGAQFLRAATTAEARFTMGEYDSTSFPGRTTPDVSIGGAFRIAGELYEVDGPLLAALDAFEAVGIEYDRQTVLLDDGQWAQMYLHLSSSARRPRPVALVVSHNGDIASWSEGAL